MSRASDPVVFTDLSPREAKDPAEEAWLGRLAERLSDERHVLRLTGDGRFDDEDLPALSRDTFGTWWAGRFIGELRFEDRILRIEPRLGMDVIGEWLASALNLNVVPKSATRSGRGPMIAQLIDRIWSAAVADASRHGGPRIRRVLSEETRHVRGRLDVRGTVRLKAKGRSRVATIRSERSLENPVARTLVNADRVLCSLLGERPAWRPDRCEETLSHLRQAVGSTPALPRDAELRRVRYSPITRPYQSLSAFSLEIAKKKGHLVSAEHDDVSGVLIDVAELWELFLVHCARLAFGAARVEHGTSEGESTFLLRSTTKPGATMGRLKPDILIRDREGRLTAVIDAKYKRLRSWRGSPHGVDRGDLYQLTSYLMAHPEAKIGVLAYPDYEGDQAPAASDGPWATGFGHGVAFTRVAPTVDRACADLVELAGGSLTEDRSAGGEKYLGIP